MKITQSAGISNAVKAYGKNIRKTAGAGKLPTDKVEISAAARELQLAKVALKALPEIREDRVEEIRKLMSSGQYKPSADDVIEKLMSGMGI